MKPFGLALLAGLALSLSWALPVQAQDDPFAQIKLCDYQTRTAPDAIGKLITAAAGDKAKLAEIERKLAAALDDPKTTVSGKQEICALLWRIGGAASVPALTRMLGDEKLADIARYGLERNPDPAAGKALRDALASAKGKPLVGIINSVGNRADAPLAVAALRPLTTNADALVANAAILALGRAGTSEAVVAIQALPAKTLVVCQALGCAADKLAAGGKTAEAQTVYEGLTAAALPASARIAGLRGLALTKSPKALGLALAALKDKEPSVQRAAGRLCALLADKDTPARYQAVYADLAPGIKSVVLAALADRGDPAGGPLAIAALATDDPVLRTAAMRACGAVGGAAAVVPLAELALKLDRGDRQLALDLLARMKGKEVEAALADLALKGKPEMRMAMLAVIADRNMGSALPMVIDAARGTDRKLAGEAYKALAKMMPVDRYGELIKLMLAAKEEDVATAAGGAVVGCARRLGDADKALGPLLAALPGASATGKIAALGVLASLGGDKALAEITKAVGDPNEDVKRAAVEALANAWEDSRPLPALLALVKNDPTPAIRSLAFGGYYRLLSQDDKLKPQDKVARVGEIVEAAPKVDQKRRALGLLRQCRVIQAAELAGKYLDTPDLFNDAAQVVLYLAAPQKEGRRDLKKVEGAAIKAALQKIVELAKDAKLKSQAEKLL